jgi:Fe-S-cluster containining protein
VKNPKEESREISCFRCGECCRKYQVLLERDELLRLAGYLHVSAGEFIEKYSDRREFLCSVHKVKPGACRAWAAAPSRRECRQGLERYWHLSLDSAGQFTGKPDDVRAFNNFLGSFETGDPASDRGNG